MMDMIDARTANGILWALAALVFAASSIHAAKTRAASVAAPGRARVHRGEGGNGMGQRVRANADWLLRDINNGLTYPNVLERARLIASLQLLDEFGSTGEHVPLAPLTYDDEDPRTHTTPDALAWQAKFAAYHAARDARDERIAAIEAMAVDELCAWLETLIAPVATAHAAD